jgi:recombinational DNA repair ATPase RecF
MSLKWLEARRFRNLTHISVDLDPGLNLLFGENGSGKTSLLESSYFLSTSRSFRDNAFDPVIQRGAEDCLLRGKVQVGGVVKLGSITKRPKERLSWQGCYRRWCWARILLTCCWGRQRYVVGF